MLDPTAFDLAPDGTFVVADAPGGNPRVQIFLASGSTLRGFRLPGRPVARVTLRNLALNGLAAIEYTGRSIFISQPENGAVITQSTPLTASHAAVSETCDGPGTRTTSTCTSR